MEKVAKKKSIELHNKDMKKVKYEIFERNYIPYLGAKGQGQENQ